MPALSKREAERRKEKARKAAKKKDPEMDTSEDPNVDDFKALDKKEKKERAKEKKSVNPHKEAKKSKSPHERSGKKDPNTKPAVGKSRFPAARKVTSPSHPEPLDTIRKKKKSAVDDFKALDKKEKKERAKEASTLFDDYSSAKSYSIKSGDSLSKIAKKHGTTVAILMAANNIKDANKIKAGASLKIPTASTLSTKNPYKGYTPKPVAKKKKTKTTKEKKSVSPHKEAKKSKSPHEKSAKKDPVMEESVDINAGKRRTNAFKAEEPSKSRKAKKSKKYILDEIFKSLSFAEGGKVGASDMSAKKMASSPDKKKKVPQYYKGGGMVKKGKMYAYGGRVAKYKG